MTTKRITRRTMLKGIGTVAIGLPFLEEMLVAPAAASPAAQVPVRAFNVFFGLGIPAPLQTEGFDGVLEPLRPLREKLLLLRNVDQVRCDLPGINAHYDGAAGAFTAEPPDGTARAGGPSLDQVIRRARYPNGQPESVIPTLIGGTFFRRIDRLARYVQSFNEDGSAAAAMLETPRDLFDRVFGAAPPAPDPAQQQRRRSVLDSVLEQYRFFTGDHSPLGAASKARVAEHLDRIREYERRAFALQERLFETPERPPASRLLHGNEADPGGQGIDITLPELVDGWRLMADLYALAIQCDRVRFGSVTFQAAGERIRLKGDYEFEGRKLFHFDDEAQHGRGGDLGCSHEWWHKYREDQPNEALRAHVHLMMREVAYFLQLLDGPEAVEANGKTILENALITISTESGDGRHNDSKRELSGVFHAVSGANGRFKTGQALDAGAEALDLYNTLLAALEVPRRMGPAEREPRPVDAIRA